MINATEMAKPFGTKPANWLRNEQAQRMIEAIAVSQKCDTADLLKVTKGGDDKSEQGTWMHEDVALVFAQWLSPEFYVWCNDRIKELLTTGITATEDMIEQILNNPDMGIALLTKLKEERAARKEAEQKVAILTHTNKTYTITEIAKELGLESAIKLNKMLEERGVQYKVNKTWVPYSDFASRGWFEIKQEVLDNGTIIYHRRVTGLGRKALLDMLGGQPIAC